MRKLRLAIAALVSVYVTGVGGLWAFQRELIYAPDHGAYVPPSRYAMLADVQEIALETADGVELAAWYVPAPADRPTVLMFPGKGSKLRNQRYRLREFDDAGMGVLLMAYRGNSGNAGTPNEQGLYDDARAALDWLAANGIEESSIVLYGVSLGTGVATRMAEERSVGAVVLEAPYTSITDVATLRFPWVPVRWLLRDRFDSLSRIATLTEPLLVMHGSDDRIIPQALGRQLFDAARAPKEGFWPNGIGHDDIFVHGGFDAARRFIEKTIASS